MPRDVHPQSITITNSVSTSSDIPMRRFAEGAVIFPAGWTACTLTVHARNPVDGNWYPVSGALGAVTVPNAASSAQVLPEELFPFDVVRLVASISGNNAIVLGLLLKD